MENPTMKTLAIVLTLIVVAWVLVAVVMALGLMAWDRWRRSVPERYIPPVPRYRILAWLYRNDGEEYWWIVHFEADSREDACRRLVERAIQDGFWVRDIRVVRVGQTINQ